MKKIKVCVQLIILISIVIIGLLIIGVLINQGDNEQAANIEQVSATMEENASNI